MKKKKEEEKKKRVKVGFCSDFLAEEE